MTYLSFILIPLFAWGLAEFVWGWIIFFKRKRIAKLLQDEIDLNKKHH